MTNSQQSLTKSDLNSFEKRINNSFKNFAEQIIETIDAFRDEFRSEILTLKNDIKEIKERLTDIDKRTIEDSNAFASSIVGIRNEIKLLDKRIKKLETLQA